MSTISTIHSTDPKIYLIEEPIKPTYWTSAKIKQVALYIFAALLAISAPFAALLAPSPFGFSAIPLIALSLILSYVSYKIKDYDNSEKLKLYRAEALTLTFQELYNEHGLKNIMHYQLLPHQELIEKFNRQVQGMDFSEVLKSFNVEELLTSRIATPAHISLLRHLSNIEETYRAEYAAAKKQIDLRYQGRSEVIKKRIHQAKLIADTTAIVAAREDNRANAYVTANAVTTPLAFVGHIIAEEVGKDAQVSYEHKMAKARAHFHHKMNLLEDQYTQYKRQL